ncbi:MAG: MarR family transcriptional regulator [Lachnospiraceae bacterium]|nr:MarR family transcriptional regulator [Lachnospiraceae bacterium]
MIKDDSNYESLRLKNQLCFPIYLCSKEMVRKYGDLLGELDLTYTQFIVMMFFWEKQNSNVKDLGKALMLDPSTLTPILKKLEAKGYIKRKRSAYDERSLDVTVTRKGKELREAALSIHENMTKCLGLAPDESEQLYALISKVLMNIEKEL